MEDLSAGHRVLGTRVLFTVPQLISWNQMHKNCDGVAYEVIQLTRWGLAFCLRDEN